MHFITVKPHVIISVVLFEQIIFNFEFFSNVHGVLLYAICILTTLHQKVHVAFAGIFPVQSSEHTMPISPQQTFFVCLLLPLCFVGGNFAL